MDDNHIRPTAYEDLGPTHLSTSFAKPTQTSKPSAEVRRIIGELGLRYRPSAQADLEAHAARIALLACDVHDIPPHLLRQAAGQWARQSKFMPTAAELVDACKALSAPPASHAIQQLHDHCEKMNKYQWVIDSGSLYFVNRKDKSDGTIEHFVDRHI